VALSDTIEEDGEEEEEARVGGDAVEEGEARIIPSARPILLNGFKRLNDKRCFAADSFGSGVI
jgi:hypothetical protein